MVGSVPPKDFLDAASHGFTSKKGTNGLVQDITGGNESKGRDEAGVVFRRRISRRHTVQATSENVYRKKDSM